MEVEMKLIKQGAEARLYLSQYNGKKCIIKERFVKKYRHPELDAQITKERMKAETKAIARCASIGISTPQLFHMDLNERKLYIEYIKNSVTAKDYIKKLSHNSICGVDDNELLNVKLNNLCNKVGFVIAKMHLNNIIHGDLTTSNMLITLRNEDNNEECGLVIIDFGLSYYSQNLEDKGVDLYVLEKALLSTHSNLTDLFTNILQSYKQNYIEKSQDVISKFEEVRARGRKRTMVG